MLQDTVSRAATKAHLQAVFIFQFIVFSLESSTLGILLTLCPFLVLMLSSRYTYILLLLASVLMAYVSNMTYNAFSFS